MRNNVSILFATLMMAVAAPALAQQASTGVGVGTDMWSGSMRPELFQLHVNGGAQACTGSEVFVTVTGSLGFCLDANENAAGAVEWEDARATCFTAGKRLPQPAEYKFACQAGVPGLSNMTDDYEWSDNFGMNTYFPVAGVSDPRGFTASATGNGSCVRGINTFVTSGGAAITSLPFRCMR